MKLSMKNFLSKCDQIRRKQKSVDLVPFTEETFNGKLHFLGSVCWTILWTLDFIDWKTWLRESKHSAKYFYAPTKSISGFIKISWNHGCFPGSLAKNYKIVFSQNTSRWFFLLQGKQLSITVSWIAFCHQIHKFCFQINRW